jgi:hypothetical protein
VKTDVLASYSSDSGRYLLPVGVSRNLDLLLDLLKKEPVGPVTARLGVGGTNTGHSIGQDLRDDRFTPSG